MSPSTVPARRPSAVRLLADLGTARKLLVLSVVCLLPGVARARFQPRNVSVVVPATMPGICVLRNCTLSILPYAVGRAAVRVPLQDL